MDLMTQQEWDYLSDETKAKITSLFMNSEGKTTIYLPHDVNIPKMAIENGSVITLKDEIELKECYRRALDRRLSRIRINER